MDIPDIFSHRIFIRVQYNGLLVAVRRKANCFWAYAFCVIFRSKTSAHVRQRNINNVPTPPLFVILIPSLVFPSIFPSTTYHDCERLNIMGQLSELFLSGGCWKKVKSIVWLWDPASSFFRSVIVSTCVTRFSTFRRIQTRLNFLILFSLSSTVRKRLKRSSGVIPPERHVVATSQTWIILNNEPPKAMHNN